MSEMKITPLPQLPLPGVVLTAEQMNALQYTPAGMHNRVSDPGWEARRDAGLGITAAEAPATVHTPTQPVDVSKTASDFLKIAQSILDQRGKQYDKPKGERSMAATVNAFNAITGQSITESHGWLLLTLLKMVRDNQRKAPHEDSCMDLVTYSSLYAEARMQSK